MSRTLLTFVRRLMHLPPAQFFLTLPGIPAVLVRTSPVRPPAVTPEARDAALEQVLSKACYLAAPESAPRILGRIKRGTYPAQRRRRHRHRRRR